MNFSHDGSDSAPVAQGGDVLSGNLTKRRITFSLSARLLLLTVIFVLIAEAAVFAPTMGRFRLDYLREKLAAAHLTMSALESVPQSIEPEMRDRLLTQSGMLYMTVDYPDMPLVALGVDQGAAPTYHFDLRADRFWHLIFDAFAAMVRRGEVIIAVKDVSPADSRVLVEGVLPESPLRAAMWAYAGRIFVLSIVISVTTAALVYLSLQWLAVRPLHKLAESMTGFQEAPDDPERIIVPSSRNDEVGIAERSLADMQRELRTALLQKDRLAGVGTAVTKISHDLKNILASAVLESARLEAVSDAKIKRITAGMVESVDRASNLAASTLRFAKEGLPDVRKSSVNLADLLEGICCSTQSLLGDCEIKISDTRSVTLSIDPELTRRVLENLLINASEAKATKIELSLRSEKTGRLLYVQDNGSGLPPRAVENIFVPFAGSGRTGGSGLGLPIARELMRAQGGDLELAATGPSGTVFEVHFPV